MQRHLQICVMPHYFKYLIAKKTKICILHIFKIVNRTDICKYVGVHYFIIKCKNTDRYVNVALFLILRHLYICKRRIIDFNYFM